MPRVITPLTIADFRNRLCEAASELLVERGMNGFNMRELAKRLHVSPMTAYRYFEDKDEILGHIRARGFARLADVLTVARLQSDAAGVLRAYVRFALEDPVTYRLMFDLFQTENSEAAELALHCERVRAAMNDVAAGPEDAPREIRGAVLWSALHGVMALYLAGKLNRPQFEQALTAAARLHAGVEVGPAASGWPLHAALTAAE